MRLLSRASCALFVSLALPMLSAHAQTTLVSNLDVGASSSGSTLNASGQKAFAFTTGSSAYDLNSVQGRFDLFGASTTLSAGLYSPFGSTGTDSSRPGTLLAGLGTQTITSAGTVTFTPSSAYTLAPNTRYVLLMDWVSGATAVWFFSNADPTARNGSGFNTFNYTFSNDNGASYGSSSSPNVVAVNGTLNPNFAVSSPEPGSVAFALPAVLAIVAGVGRRKRHVVG